jgi:glucose dehydrogenase
MTKRALLIIAVCAVALGVGLAGLMAQQSPSYIPELAKPGFPGWGEAVPTPQRDAEPAPPLGKPTDWPSPWGGDPGGSKFSTLNQINTQNVKNLTVAWSYDTGYSTNDQYQHNPCVINNVMYLPSGRGVNVVALQADTGKELWKVALGKDIPGIPANSTQNWRGPAYWPGTGTIPPRVIVLTTNGYIVQLDAKTGKLIDGPPSVINLAVGVMEKFGGIVGTYSTHMPPAIYKNLVLLAARTGEQGRYGLPGDPRAFDLITGKEVWRYHAVPYAGDLNFGTWGLDGWQDRRGPGAWVPFAVDFENDLVFVPHGNPTDQNYGGSRPGINLYSETLVAARASTGQIVWWQQTTHHDINDNDSNAQPTLTYVWKDGKQIPVVVMSTKQGYVFIFNRFTGEPVWGMEEVPVHQGDAPGEYTWPTQPIPIKPTFRSRDQMRRSEVSKITPEAEKYCTETFDKSFQAGPYTPYSMVPAMVFPGSEAGISWGGVATDPERRLLFVNHRDVAVIAQLQASTSSGVLPSFAKSKVPTTFWVDPQGYPCSAPPWSELTAISLETGDTVWQVPLGEYPELTAKGILGTGGAHNDGGPIATAGGLVFIGTSPDSKFRAFDSKTGKVLWEHVMPDDVLNIPLTYQGGDGRQYVVAIASGGDVSFHIPAKKTPYPNVTVVAFALPK